METEQLHDGSYLRILWDSKTRIIGIEWKDATATMTSEEFKTDLMLFATHAEVQRARGILVNVARFRHKIEPGVHQWRVKNISTRYSAAGVRRFAFLLPAGAQIPPMMNESSPGEKFLTRAFDDVRNAEDWLMEAGNSVGA